jgi:Electron transfer DM13
MTTQRGTSRLRRKWIPLTLGLLVLVALWWAFRPEKLWINETVNEPAPFEASGDPQPLFTGRFESKAQQTSGRATIYKRPDAREYLRLNDFTTAHAADVRVALVGGDDGNPSRDGIDLGPLKSNRSDQNYDLPPATDLNRYQVVVIYSAQSSAQLARAKLEPF